MSLFLYEKSIESTMYLVCTRIYIVQAMDKVSSKSCRFICELDIGLTKEITMGSLVYQVNLSSLHLVEYIVHFLKLFLFHIKF